MGSKMILSHGELKSLENEKRDLEATVDAYENGSYGMGTRARELIDIGGIKRQIKMLERKIQEGSPGRITGVTKDKLQREADKLAALIQDGMPTRDEIWLPRGRPGLVQKQALWEKRNSVNIRRWKQIMRQLEPNDPTAASIERLRK